MATIGTALRQGWVVAHHRLQPLYAAYSTLALRPAASPQPWPTPTPAAAGGRAGRPRHASSAVCQAYASPEIYDIAFSFRNFEQEAAYLLDAYQQHSTGPLGRAVEIGCGPARHSILLAQSAGCDCTALDISQPMLDYAAHKAAAAGVADKLHFAQADMTTPFAEGLLQGGQPLADMALLLLGTLAHCLDNAAAVTCFQQLARLVRPGGLLVVELPHPEELFSGGYYRPDQFVDAWDTAAGDKTVLVEWGREGDEFDAQTQVLGRTVGMTLYDGQELVTSNVQTVEQRQFTYQELELLGRLSGFEVAAVHGDFNSTVTLADEDAYRMIVCLQRAQV